MASLRGTWHGFVRVCHVWKDGGSLWELVRDIISRWTSSEIDFCVHIDLIATFEVHVDQLYLQPKSYRTMHGFQWMTIVWSGVGIISIWKVFYRDYHGFIWWWSKYIYTIHNTYTHIYIYIYIIVLVYIQEQLDYSEAAQTMPLIILIRPSTPWGRNQLGHISKKFSSAFSRLKMFD